MWYECLISKSKVDNRSLVRTASLSSENTDVPDVMNSNRKFDVSLDGSLLSHTTNMNAFVLTTAVRICQVRELKNRKYQLPVAIFDVRDVNVTVDGGPYLALIDLLVLVSRLLHCEELIRNNKCCKMQAIPNASFG